MNVITYNQNDKQPSNNPLLKLVYINPKVLTDSEKEQLRKIFWFIKIIGNDTVCNKLFTPSLNEFPCLVEREEGSIYLTVWSKHPTSYNSNKRLMCAKSYIEFITIILFWLNDEHSSWLEQLSKQSFAKNLQTLINSKRNENQLQNQTSTGQGSNRRGSIIDGGRTTASITVKPLSNKEILG